MKRATRAVRIGVSEMRLRLVTLNLWNEQGPHEPRLAVAARQLESLQPDVIALQEVRERPPDVPNQAATLAEYFGMTHAFTAVADWKGGTEGLAILARGRIRNTADVALPDPENLGPRRALAACVEAADGIVAIVTTHLAYPLAAGRTREAQVVALDAFARAQDSSGVRVICGDLNASADTDEIRFLRGATTLDGKRTFWQDAFARAHPEQLSSATSHTWSSRNIYAAAQEHLELDRRIDYVLVSSRLRDGRAGVLDARVVLDEPEHGVWSSDHFGVLADIEV